MYSVMLLARSTVLYGNSLGLFHHALPQLDYNLLTTFPQPLATTVLFPVATIVSNCIYFL